MKSIVSEKLLERKLREGVKRAGGLALKWTSPGVSGVPDRIVILPGGKVAFVELKSTGQPTSKRQDIVFREIWKRGHDVWIIDDEVSLTNFLKSL